MLKTFSTGIGTFSARSWDKFRLWKSRVKHRIKWRRFWMSMLGLTVIFAVNTVGLYRNGFVAQYYWVSQVEHFVGGFFLVLLFSSFYNSNGKIILGATYLGLLWELFEFAVAYSPWVASIVSHVLYIGAISVTWPDTILDIFLNLLGAVIFIAIFKKRAN